MSGLTETQRQLRKSGVTASELAWIFGMGSGSPSKLYKVKCEGFEEPDNPFLERGRALEGKVLARYAEVYGVQLLDVGTRRHPTRPLLLATPDAVVEGKRVIEAKAPTVESDLWGAPGTDLCPPQFIIQCQAQLAVMSLPEAHLVRPSPGEDPNTPGFKLDVYTIPQDPELFEYLAAAAEDFWNRYVLTGTRPPGYRASKKKAEDQHP